MAELREWPNDKFEVSGFGGSYEAGCRVMILAGIKWLEEHPDANPAFKGFKKVFGLVLEDNEDAKALTNAMMDHVMTHPEVNNGEPFKLREQATGAMHHAAIYHCLMFKRNGWEWYKAELMKGNNND